MCRSVFHGADLQSLEVLNGLNGTSGENISEADVHPADSVNALSGGLLCDKLTDLTVDNAMSLIGIIERKGWSRTAISGMKEVRPLEAVNMSMALLERLPYIFSLVSSWPPAKTSFDLDAAFGCFLNFLSDRESAPLWKLLPSGSTMPSFERDDIGRTAVSVLRPCCPGLGAVVAVLLVAAACEQAGDNAPQRMIAVNFFHFFLLLPLKIYLFS